MAAPRGGFPVVHSAAGQLAAVVRMCHAVGSCSLPVKLDSGFRRSNMNRSSITACPEQWTVSLLKEFCRARNLKQAGKKADLLQR